MQSLRLPQLDFASLLAYTPRLGGELGQQSRDLMHALKDGRLTGTPPISMSVRIADRIKKGSVSFGLFSPFLKPSAVLVPVPKSSLQREGSLWVPQQLAGALVQAGLGARVGTLLLRTEPIPKAATSIPSERPTASKHYMTLSVQKDLSPTPEILLVDDVVTTGAALLGSANRLHESYPGVPIRGFAAIRTITNPTELTKTTQPIVGTITLRDDGWCLRRP